MLTKWSILAGFLLLRCPLAAASLPNPQTDPTACHADGAPRICDPDGILSQREKGWLQQEISTYEAHTITCHDDVVQLQVGVALIWTMNQPFATDWAAAARQQATDIHNDWGVGYQTPCGGSGILIFLALRDHQIFFSRGAAMRHVLNDKRLSYIIEKMKPDLRDGRYEEALRVAIELMTDYVEGQNPEADETREGLILFFGIVGGIIAYCSCIACCSARASRRERKFRNNLTKLDRDRAQALQGVYKATACPICLEDFQHVHGNNKTLDEEKALLEEGNANEDNLVGSDGRPLQLLPCGHVFDQTCWEDFSRHPSTAQSTDGGLRCPICRQPTTTTLNDSRENRVVPQAYQDERRFRLERLQYMYPTYVSSPYASNWRDPNYQGRLSDDYEAHVQREREAAAARAAASNANSGGSGFGGGSADGGGVGGSW